MYMYMCMYKIMCEVPRARIVALSDKAVSFIHARAHARAAPDLPFLPHAQSDLSASFCVGVVPSVLAASGSAFFAPAFFAALLAAFLSENIFQKKAR